MAAGRHLAWSAVARHRLGLGRACPPWRGASGDSRCIASALEMRVASASASPPWLDPSDLPDMLAVEQEYLSHCSGASMTADAHELPMNPQASSHPQRRSQRRRYNPSQIPRTCRKRQRATALAQPGGGNEYLTHSKKYSAILCETCLRHGIILNIQSLKDQPHWTQVFPLAGRETRLSSCVSPNFS